MTLIVGLEGPVLAGKSTAAATVARGLIEQNISCHVVSCFVDFAKSLGISVPDVSPRTVDKQVEAVKCYLTIDEYRRELINSDVAILDRTCWTLLAHTSALVAIGGVDAVNEVERQVYSANLFPDYVVYFDISHDEQIRRSKSREILPTPLLDNSFNSAFRMFFERNWSECEGIWINARGTPSRIAQEIQEKIMSWVTDKRTVGE